jgi:pyridoxamine 5'-phosphate oxidase
MSESVSLEVANLRRDYSTRGLRREDLSSEPFSQFRQWFQEAQKADLLEPNAMTCATADRSGRVTARTVLLKAFDERGFVFFTNTGSTKARQMTENPQAALLFAWLPLERQVSIAGQVEKINTAETLAYFASRPFGSKLGAWVSMQSSIIPSRKILEMKFEEMKTKFSNGEVPLPDFWSGFRVVPQTIEFWQGGQDRLHDRFLYTRHDGALWSIDRLSP